MIYGSVCSGIEAATMAWHSLGWRPAFFSEIEAFPRAVLKHHYPEVPLHGDFTTIQSGTYAPIRLLVGGTPCQDFSVAGLRKGLAGERGNLTLEYLKLVDRLRPEWVVWENVPGVLSQDKGRAFGAFLGGLGQLGYRFAYRVFDAQYVRVDILGRAVPQRRRRVFVVGHSRDWRRAAAVLFERESVFGNTPPRRKAGEGVAPTISARTQGGGGLGTDFDLDGGLVAKTLRAHHGDAHRADLSTYVPEIMAQALTSKISKGTSGPAGDEHHNLIAFSAKDYGADASAEVSPTLRSGGFDTSHANGGVMPAIAFAIQGAATRENPESGPDGIGVSSAGAAYTLEARSEVQAVAHSLRADGFDASEDGTGRGTPLVPEGWRVRRLTPRECERLQGFPDDFTLVPFRNKPASDGPRYKAMGNSMAVNVMRWIGQRIELVDRMDNQFGELG